MSRRFRINGKILVRVLADLEKPTEVRVGREKGNHTCWIARVSTRQIFTDCVINKTKIHIWRTIE